MGGGEGQSAEDLAPTLRAPSRWLTVARAKWPGVVPGPSRTLCREGVASWDGEVLRVNDGHEPDLAGRLGDVERPA